jgi:hypothetical protein
MWLGTVVAYFKKLSRQSLGRSDERNETRHSLESGAGLDLNKAKAETSLRVQTRRWRCIAEGGSIHNYRCENLRSYKGRKVIYRLSESALRLNDKQAQGTIHSPCVRLF